MLPPALSFNLFRRQIRTSFCINDLNERPEHWIKHSYKIFFDFSLMQGNVYVEELSDLSG